MSGAYPKDIMDADQIRRAVTRIAHEISERNPGVRDLVLIGIMNRGDVLASRIAAEIGRIEQSAAPVGALDISFHRDDAAKALGRPAAQRPTHLPFSIENKCVVLVDDVLFTGRSIRAAMDELIDYGRPRAIQLAVLVDRGHRELPIHADFVGKNVPTARDESVDVRLQERDGEDKVMVTRGGDQPREKR